MAFSLSVLGRGRRLRALLQRGGQSLSQTQSQGVSGSQQPHSRGVHTSDPHDPERSVNYHRPNPAHRYRWTWDEEDHAENPIRSDQKVYLKRWMVDQSVPDLERTDMVMHNIPEREFDQNTGSWRNPRPKNPKWVNLTFITQMGERATVRAMAGVDTLTSVCMRNKIFHIWPMCGAQQACEYCHCYVPDQLAAERPMSLAELKMFTGTDFARGTASSRMGCQITVTEAMEGMVFGLPAYKDKSFGFSQSHLENDPGMVDIQPPILRHGTDPDMEDLYPVDPDARKRFKKARYPGPDHVVGKTAQPPEHWPGEEDSEAEQTGHKFF